LDELPEHGVERERLSPAQWDYGRKRAPEYTPRADVPVLSTGDSVRHSTMGEGVVTQIEAGGVVTVRFEDGSERRLMLDLAPLVRALVPRVSPRSLLVRLPARFGYTSIIRSAALGPPPPITRQHYGYFGKGVQPPADALWIYLRSSPSRRIEWEEDLFAGALRDELCLHRARPLAGWSDGRRVTGISDPALPFGQRF